MINELLSLIPVVSALVPDANDISVAAIPDGCIVRPAVLALTLLSAEFNLIAVLNALVFALAFDSVAPKLILVLSGALIDD